MKDWWHDVDYRIAVAEHAWEEGELADARAIFYFLEKPWKFPELHDLYDNWQCRQGETQDEFNAREP